MKSRGVLTLALLLYATVGFASQVMPFIDEREIGVTIESTVWPETLNKDLTSGLTNRILIRARLLRGTQVVQQRAIEIAVRYDLWDERFAMNVLLEGIEVEARTIQTKEQVFAELGALRLRRLFAVSNVTRTQPYVITAEVLLNPIDRERMEMIKKWVAENSAGPTDIGASPTGEGLGVSLFNRIFEQYAKGADWAAAWRETSSSEVFRLEDLGDEGP